MMARKKEYIEEEVIEKATNLFWRNGYQTTSMQMLEKEMGINKFSIYASFGSKTGVFLECIKNYRSKLRCSTDKLKASENGVEGVKQYFYDFLDFSKDTEQARGCLVTNAANQSGKDTDPEIKAELSKFTSEIRQLFANSLKQDKSKDMTTLEAQADYLIISMLGLSSASRLFNKTELNNYIENIFKNV